MDNSTTGFANLTPDIVLSSVENAMGTSLTGLITPFPSYINRVYEIETDTGERLVAKFYRPGRWTQEALKEEHVFMQDCEDRDIPVVCPVKLSDDNTLGNSNGFYFSVFPKKSGRLFELNSDEDYLRAGALIGRIHSSGISSKAEHRIILDPSFSTRQDLDELLSGNFISGNLKADFKKVTDEILDLIIPLFKGVKKQRIHGDCHLGNILSRPGSDGNDSLMIIDFDDMAMGPAMQDLWLLLPGHLSESRKELNLLIEGYEQFLSFDYSTSRLVEPLRAMRIIYFLAWCGRQIDDLQFQHNFPDWGTDKFWENEILDLKKQLEEIRESVQA
ncbi:MAG: serine/threonine protein kinase [Spirochaetota bacterium]|nr:serine/threonine protein kinase [Spirochaetota bacterium]